MKRLVTKAIKKTFVDAEVGQFYGGLYEKKGEKKQKNSLGNSSSEYLQLVKELHPSIFDVNFGCGSPIPKFNIEGLNVLDLGSGSGKDCFILWNFVGLEGNVIGVDTTEEAIKFSTDLIDYHKEKFGLDKNNIQFIKGDIENLQEIGIEDNSIDVVISNCVLNLTNKKNTFAEIHRVLKDGGELYFSDVFCDKRIPKEIKEIQQFKNECVSGAHYINDFEFQMKEVGFNNFRIVTGKVNQTVEGSVQAMLVETLKEKEMNIDPTWFSLTIRAFKIPELEQSEENYGDIIKYTGERVFPFDYNQIFKNNKEYAVSRNTYNSIKNSRFNSLFEFKDPSKIHQGRFEEPNNWEIIEMIRKKTSKK